MRWDNGRLTEYLPSPESFVEIIQLPAFTDNYVWLLREGDRTVVVDPGDAAPVERYLQHHALTLTAILVTHHHHDHIDGIPALLARGAVPVYGPARAEMPFVTHPVHGGERLEFPGLSVAFEVISTAGHTRDQVAYYGPGHVFCGDALFTFGCGRLFEGTAAEAHASLGRLARLPADTRIHCAHEYTANNLPFAETIEPDNPDLQARARRDRERIAAGQPTVPSTLAEELASNPFLRCQSPQVVAAATRHAGHALDSDEAVFATLRAWRNTFVAPASR